MRHSQRPPRRMMCTLLVALVFALTAAACASSRAVQVLGAPPAFAHRVLGMTSGQGPNYESAVAAVVENAARLEADAVVVENQRQVGQVVIVTARMIRYLAPPPPPPQGY